MASAHWSSAYAKVSFMVADVKTSILGAEFFANYKLLIDLHNRKLLDCVTELSINALEICNTFNNLLTYILLSIPCYPIVTRLYNELD